MLTAFGESTSQDNSRSLSGETEMYRNLQMNVAGVMKSVSELAL
jgi:hypothetical protein